MSRQPKGAIFGHQPKEVAGRYSTTLSIMSLYIALCLAHPLASLPKRKAGSDSSCQRGLLHASSNVKSPESNQESLSPLKAGHLHHAQPQPTQKVLSEPKLRHPFARLAMPPTYMHQETPPLGLAKQPLQHLIEGGVGEGSHFWQ